MDASYFRDVGLIAMHYSWSMHLFFEISDRLRCIWRDGCIVFSGCWADCDALFLKHASLFWDKWSIAMHLTGWMHRFLEISGLLRCIWTLLNWFLILQPPVFHRYALNLFDTDDWPDPSVSEIRKKLSYRHQCCRNRINSLIYDTTHTETCRKPIKTHVNDEKYAFQNEKASSHLRQRQFT